MNLSRVMRNAALSGALVCFSTTIAWAGCDNKDRPATPTGLRLSVGTTGWQGPAPKVLFLLWQNNQTRTGLTYFDIHLRDGKGKNLGVDVTGGAGQEMKSGERGTYTFHNPPPADEYVVSMRARTKAGTEGCVSGAESEPASIKAERLH
jgi:hypothetical protein